MKTKIKNAIAAAILALFATGAQASAFTIEDAKEYATELPKLSYQAEAIDCEMANKVGAIGAWWAANEEYDVRKDPRRVAMHATFEILEFNAKANLLNLEYVDPENMKKGGQEILDTYEGFFIEAVLFGPKINKKLSLKEKRAAAKEVGNSVAVDCWAMQHYQANGEHTEKHPDFRLMLAVKKIAAGDFE